MKKRGQAEIIGLLVLCAMVAISGFTIVTEVGSNRYVGDTTTKIVYDLLYCDVHIESQNKINFESTTQFEHYISDLNYTNAPCNR